MQNLCCCTGSLDLGHTCFALHKRLWKVEQTDLGCCCASHILQYLLFDAIQLRHGSRYPRGSAQAWWISPACCLLCILIQFATGATQEIPIFNHSNYIAPPRSLCLSLSYTSSILVRPLAVFSSPVNTSTYGCELSQWVSPRAAVFSRCVWGMDVVDTGANEAAEAFQKVSAVLFFVLTFDQTGPTMKSWGNGLASLLELLLQPSLVHSCQGLWNWNDGSL